MIRAVIFACALPLIGCVQAYSENCKQVCEREAECDEVRVRGGDFDASECARECTRLERDRDGRQLITNHLDCARKAKTCDALLECR